MTVLAPAQELVSISTSNKKTETASISLPPGQTCAPGAPCFRKDGCYAWKMYFGTAPMYRNIRAAWDRNLRIYQASGFDYFGQVSTWLKKHKPPYFRWHVGGDFPDKTYLGWALEVAKRTPDTQHTAYTKRYQWALDLAYLIPNNFTMVTSGWPGIDMPKEVHDHFPTFWMLDPKDPDPRIPANVDVCPGSCPTCRWCWNIAANDIVNHKH